MDNNQQENRKHKQQHESEDDQSKKVPKLDVIERPTLATEPKSITNIYYNCLERIFELLDFANLLNVAQTCKRLQIAAAANFNDRYGKRTIVLFSKIAVDDVQGIYGNGNDNDIYVVGKRFCLPFLRCFGSKISHFEIQCAHERAHSNFIDIIDRYINQYCADTLSEIAYVGREEKFSNELFVKPFKMVEIISILTSNNFNQLSNFVDWFPNLRTMKLDSSALRSCTPVHFPLLEHLDVHFTYNSMTDCVKFTKDILHANERLKYVGFEFANRNLLTMSNVLDMISNRWIRMLWIMSDENDVKNVDASELLRLASEHRGITYLDLQPYLLNTDDAIAFIDILDGLEEFIFRVKNRFEYDRLISKLDSKWQHKLDVKEEHHIITLTTPAWYEILKKTMKRFESY